MNIIVKNILHFEQFCKICGNNYDSVIEKMEKDINIRSLAACMANDYGFVYDYAKGGGRKITKYYWTVTIIDIDRDLVELEALSFEDTSLVSDESMFNNN